mgnify:CR=1 FL=1|jgi:hypothetical protein
MRVFNNSSIAATQTKSTQRSGRKSKIKAKKEAPIKAKRLSPAEVQAKFEQLKMEKATNSSMTKRKQAFEQSKRSQFMGGGIFKNPDMPQDQPFLEKKIVPKENIIVGEELELNSSPNTADYTLDSDIKTNAPDAEVTKEKLKSALSLGSFKFSDKERKVLSQILGE